MGGEATAAYSATAAGRQGPVRVVTGPAHSTEPRFARASRRQWVQSRRLVRRVHVWSVVKVSVLFYLLVFVSFLVASVVLWYVANAVGAVHSIDKSVRILFDLKTFTLHPRTVATYAALAGGLLVVVGTIVNILAALAYNLISDVIGGVEVDIVTDAE